MPKTKLTDSYLKAIPNPDSGRAFHWDTARDGLALMATSNGGRSWYVVKRIPRGPVVKYKFGTYPATTLLQARVRARELLGLIDKGVHPGEQEREQKRQREAQRREADRLARETFGALWERFMADYVAVNCRPEHARKYRGTFRAEPVQAWKERPLRELARKDVREALEHWTRAKKYVAANRARAHLSRFFRWAVEREYIDASPVEGTTRPLREEKPRDRLLTDAELRALWRASAKAGDVYGRLVRVVMLTGARLREAAGMRWDELSLEDDAPAWRVPSERMKNKREHLVPLSSAVVAEIKALQSKAGDAAGPYVFSLDGGKKPINGFGKPKARLDEAARVDDWHHHDLRTALATFIERAGFGVEVAAAVLSHRKPSASAATLHYALHEYDAEKRRALNKWAAHIDRVVHEKEAPKVVPIKSGA